MSFSDLENLAKEEGINTISKTTNIVSGTSLLVCEYQDTVKSLILSKPELNWLFELPVVDNPIYLAKVLKIAKSYIRDWSDIPPVMHEVGSFAHGAENTIGYVKKSEGLYIVWLKRDPNISAFITDTYGSLLVSRNGGYELRYYQDEHFDTRLVWKSEQFFTDSGTYCTVFCRNTDKAGIVPNSSLDELFSDLKEIPYEKC